jgi:signal transduction histidine kinase/ActR/RegA family two-component response regulator
MQGTQGVSRVEGAGQDLPTPPDTAPGGEPPGDRSRAALDFAHRLLAAPATDWPGLDRLLADLAAAFAAAAAGLATLPDGALLARSPSVPANFQPPWVRDAELIPRARAALTALTVPSSEVGPLLLSAFAAADGSSWLLWLEAGSRSGWTDGEAAALPLVGHTLSRRLGAPAGEGTPRWAGQLDRAGRQQRLENAAQVARRLAHDFGNVLTSIIGFTELALAQQVPANTPLHSYLTEVHRSAQSGAQFTHQLRLFSRRQPGSSSCCPLHVVLVEEEARFRSASAGTANLRVALAPDLPSLAIDADHLRQVLAVLLDNARDAVVGSPQSAAGGAVREVGVSARLVVLAEADCRDLFGDARPGAHVEISVTDNGPGLSAEARRLLFAEPFFSTRPRRRGFGLSIAYGILRAYRGGLDVSAQPGGGTIARILLPVGIASPVSAPASAAAGKAGSGDTVLVVDDDPMILQLVSATLEQAGYRVQAASNGEDALRAYQSAPPDRPFRLVLTDVYMPRISGLDLARRLLRHDAAVRLLFMSGQAPPELSQQDLGGQHIDLLAKPFRPESLLRAVRQALDRSPTRRPEGCTGSGPIAPSRK